MEKWKKVRTKETFHFGGYYRVEVDEVVTPGGRPGTYSVVRLNPYSVIVPIDAEGRIHMVRQHRYATDTVTLEFPMGSTDGQDSLVGAKRELEEESGLESVDWLGLGRIQALNGTSDSIGHLYLARDVRLIHKPKLDPADQGGMDQLFFSVDEIRKMITRGEIEDASTICAFAKVEMLGLFGK